MYKRQAINRKLLPLSVQSELETREAELQLQLLTKTGFSKTVFGLLEPYFDALGIILAVTESSENDQVTRSSQSVTTKLPHDKGETGDDGNHENKEHDNKEINEFHETNLRLAKLHMFPKVLQSDFFCDGQD